MSKNQLFKIIFVDLDWTLLDHKNKRFDTKSIKALKKAQNKGIMVYICTARPYDSLKGTGVFDLLKPDGVICTNGAVIFVGDKLVYQKIIPPFLVKRIIEIADQHDLVIEFSDPKTRWFNKEVNSLVDSYFCSYNESFPSIEDFNYQCVNSILLFSTRDIDDMFLKSIKYKISYYRFCDVAVDISLCPQYKSEGITFLLNYLNIDKSQSISFGDDIPDIKMFESTGFGVAVSKKDEVKKASSFISKTVDKHGVSYALKKLKII